VGHVSVKVDGRPCPCGGAGCVEQYASGSAIARAAQAAINEMQDTSLRALPGAPTAADVLGAARAGDDCATRILADAAWHLGGALATLVNLFNPAVIVLGGGVSDAGDLFLVPAAESMAGRLPAVLSGSVALRRVELGGQSAVIGAALLAWDRLGGGTGA
jgi:glucokinase